MSGGLLNLRTGEMMASAHFSTAVSTQVWDWATARAWLMSEGYAPKKTPTNWKRLTRAQLLHILSEFKDLKETWDDHECPRRDSYDW